MASSTFNPMIPQPTDQISQSQPQILTNFFQSNYLIGFDHVAWNATNSTSRGQHLKITFNAPLTMDPNQVAPIASLYTKTVTNPELFYQNGTTMANVLQLTNSLLTRANGEGMLAGGLQIKCGSGSTPVVYTTAFPTACIAVTITSNNANRYWYIGTLNGLNGTTGFTAIGSPNTAGNFFWIAVGY